MSTNFILQTVQLNVGGININNKQCFTFTSIYLGRKTTLSPTLFYVNDHVIRAVVVVVVVATQLNQDIHAKKMSTSISLKLKLHYLLFSFTDRHSQDILKYVPELFRHLVFLVQASLCFSRSKTRTHEYQNRHSRLKFLIFHGFPVFGYVNS